MDPEEKGDATLVLQWVTHSPLVPPGTPPDTQGVDMTGTGLPGDLFSSRNGGGRLILAQVVEHYLCQGALQHLTQGSPTERWLLLSPPMTQTDRPTDSHT